MLPIKTSHNYHSSWGSACSSPHLHLTPIHEVSTAEELDGSYSTYQEAMEPLSFLPEVDLVPLTPASKEALRRYSRGDSAPFQRNISSEDLAVLAGAAFETSTSSWLNIFGEEGGSGEGKQGWKGLFQGPGFFDCRICLICSCRGLRGL